MINRRNDRRRRLMSEEYVSTFVAGDDSAANESSLGDKAEPEKRAYALGANRGSQLKTTDLFPKKIWVITLCGITLFGFIASLNLLNFYAPAWRPYIGNASVRAISLAGAGTLASWMLAMMLFLTGLASLQIFALRKHRCDDYGGTYRIWLIVPPIFFVASIASIVDFEAIIYQLASLAQLTSGTNDSLVPMTIKLSLLAIIMVRMLFEIRDSKAAFSMLVIAWLAFAISTVLNTQWAENRIGSQELALATPNAVLVATISLMLAHLFYVRFVYLHAHGAIAVKTRVTAKADVSRPTRSARSASKKKNSAMATEALKAPAKPQPAKRSYRKSTKVPQTATVVEPAATKSGPAEADSAPPVPSSNSAKKKSATMSDFQSLLKQKQAEKTVAEKTATEQASTQSSSAPAPLTSARDDVQSEAVIKMSKSQRRRARKSAKAKRKAA